MGNFYSTYKIRLIFSLATLHLCLPACQSIPNLHDPSAGVVIEKEQAEVFNQPLNTARMTEAQKQKPVLELGTFPAMERSDFLKLLELFTKHWKRCKTLNPQSSIDEKNNICIQSAYKAARTELSVFGTIPSLEVLGNSRFVDESGATQKSVSYLEALQKYAEYEACAENDPNKALLAFSDAVLKITSLQREAILTSLREEQLLRSTASQAARSVFTKSCISRSQIKKSVLVKGLLHYPCTAGHETPIFRNYTLSTEMGYFRISGTFEYRYLGDHRDEFEDRLAVAKRAAQAFFSKHGIYLDLKLKEQPDAFTNDVIGRTLFFDHYQRSFAAPAERSDQAGAISVFHSKGVAIGSKDGRTLYNSTTPIALAEFETYFLHEFMHYLGLPDRYNDSNCPARSTYFTKRNGLDSIMFGGSGTLKLYTLAKEDLEVLLNPICEKNSVAL